MDPVGILRFLILLSVLVVVHEFGHFIVAKLGGICVERFSLGMPPRLFGFRWGETDYCVSLIPFGGYVKMAGQEDFPSREKGEEEGKERVPEGRRFNAKPVRVRASVIAAGPFMNLLLSFVLFTALARLGMEKPSPLVGGVEEGSPAEMAGVRPGDRVLAVDGETIITFDRLQSKTLRGAGEPLRLTLGRGEETLKVSVLSRSLRDPEGPGIGVHSAGIPVIGSLVAGYPAVEAGLQVEDRLLTVNGERAYLPQAVSIFSKSAGRDLSLTVERAGERKTLSVRPRKAGTLEGLDLVEGVVKYVDPLEPQLRSIRRGDRVVAVDGKNVLPGAVAKRIWERSEGSIRLEMYRPSFLFLRPPRTYSVMLKTASKGLIGVVFACEPITTMEKHPSLAGACLAGLRETWETVKGAFWSLGQLVTRKVSPREITGVVGIYKVTNVVAETGFSPLVQFVGMVSVYLAVFNILPIPVLDGGHLLFLVLEKVRRKPLGQRPMEIIQQAFLILLIGLMLYVTYNDIVYRILDH